MNISTDGCVKVMSFIEPLIPQFERALIVASAAKVLVANLYMFRPTRHHVLILPVAAGADGVAGARGMCNHEQPTFRFDFSHDVGHRACSGTHTPIYRSAHP